MHYLIASIFISVTTFYIFPQTEFTLTLKDPISINTPDNPHNPLQITNLSNDLQQIVVSYLESQWTPYSEIIPQVSMRTALAAHPKKSVIAVGNNNGEIYLYDLKTSSLLQTFKGKKKTIKCLTYSMDGKYLAVNGEESCSSVQLLDAESLQSLYEFQSDESTYSEFLSFSPDSKLLFNVYTTGEFIIWDLATYKNKYDNPLYFQYFQSAVMLPDSKTMIIASTLNDPMIVDIESRQIKGKLEIGRDQISHLYCTPNGLFTVGLSTTQVVYVWHTESKKIVRQAGRIVATHSENCNPILTMSADGNYIATADLDYYNELSIWNLPSGMTRVQIIEMKEKLKKMVFSFNGNFLIYLTKKGKICIFQDAKHIFRPDVCSNLNKHVKMQETVIMQNLERCQKAQELIKASADNDIAKLNQLITGKADCNALDEQEHGGETALIIAIRNNAYNYPAAALLIAAPQCDVNKQNSHGDTALIFAASIGKHVAVKLLLLKPNIDVNCKNKWGATALIAAAQCSGWGNSEEIVRLLVARPEVDLFATDHTGKTALQLANSEIKAQLIEQAIKKRNNKPDSACTIL